MAADRSPSFLVRFATRTGIKMQKVTFSALLASALLLVPMGIEAFAQPIPSSARPGQRSCSERGSLRSLKSTEPTKITFVNKSGMYRGIVWMNFKGGFQDFGGLNSGESKTIDTFRTHPWMITTGPGDCLQIILPSAEPGIAVLK
jgi:hypothetical protein